MKKCMLRVKVGGWGGEEPQHRQLGCPVPWVGGKHREGTLHEGASEASALLQEAVRRHRPGSWRDRCVWYRIFPVTHVQGPGSGGKWGLTGCLM